MKKILIALDYDPTAQKVAEQGYALAKAMDAEVTLIHVIADPVFYAYPEYSPIMGYDPYSKVGSFQSASSDQLKKAALNFLEKSKQHLGDDRIKISIAEGDFAESIVNAAKEIKASLIVMGSHSRRWLEDLLIGSVTTKVLQISSLPLFIIPTKKK
jgi:nucleotide-binding universal stress UspA family protein